MMNLPHRLDEAVNGRLPLGYGGRFYGVYPAVVTDITDPDGHGRVRVKLPWSPDAQGQAYEAWARLATMMAGNNRGSWFIPDVNDEVLVIFEAGDTRWPYVVGALWNGQDTPPQTMDSAGKNYLKKLRSRNGIIVTLDDTDGQETLTLETPGGQTVILKDGPGSVEVRDSNGNNIKMESSGTTVTTSAKVTVNASLVEINSSQLSVNAGMAIFSGTVQAPTVIASSVIGSSYTPGAGNIW
jgi:uncharacterized protein involved in type VI secretion and phage assembly